MTIVVLYFSVFIFGVLVMGKPKTRKAFTPNQVTTTIERE
jgi:hypothetical protein